MITSKSLILFFLTAAGTAGYAQAPQATQDRATHQQFDEIVFFDRLHQTFVLLNQVAIPAYLEHFSGEPDNLAVVEYYAQRLASVLRNDPWRSGDPNSDGAAPDENAPRDVWMRATLSELARNSQQAAERYLKRVGSEPHAELHRMDATREANTARCVLYDPALFGAYRRLHELKSGRSLAPIGDNVSQSLEECHGSIRSLRDQPVERELSLRKFLDKNRSAVWQLAWLYRCRGIELEAGSAAARACFLRALSLGEALFPASERGRLDRFDPIFLAELGDVFARLERFDLMLRYIYCDNGLPARYELTRPVAELARVAESIRLMRADVTTVSHDEQELPETVSQILFDRPVLAQAGTAAKGTDSHFENGSGLQLGWLLMGAGGCLVVVAIAWCAVRAARRPRHLTSKV
jgi:hypothetical protein